jgi:endogenous inhibitor of DNA gyrase (YacG/DUF329 family)
MRRKRKAMRTAWQAARSKARRDARIGRRCELCDKAILAKRSTRQFCSTRCRVRDHRCAPVLVGTRRWVAAYEVWRAAMASAAYRASVAAESPSEQDTKSAR